MWMNLFLQFVLPVLVRQGVTIVTAGAAAHGLAIGSYSEAIIGTILAMASAGWSAWRGSPNNLLRRAAAHPDPQVAAIVRTAQEQAAVGNSPAQV
jgi:hypothetical protein